MSEELGRKLKDAREARALSIREVAKQSGELSYSALSRIERGERYPNVKTLTRICAALGVEIVLRGGVVEVRVL